MDLYSRIKAKLFASTDARIEELEREVQTLMNYSTGFTFHNGVTDASVPNGFVYNNTEGRKTVTFGIAGTSTSQVYEFHIIDAAGNDNLLTCYRATDSQAGTGTSVKGETWQATIEGVASFYVKLISVSGGTAIVKGNITT